MSQSPEFLALGAEAQRAKAAYERARDAVLTITRDASSHPRTTTSTDPSAYWREELATIDYMIEASPLIVRKLRHHSFHITGIRPYDYRSKGDTRRAHFEARLQALRELAGDSLLVPESPALGGFGYDIGGRLFNVDTLKFFEVLIGMERGGVLGGLRDRERPVVCEIGAGWGGFAYQFKTLVPRSTYVIVDFPELFLFSATYLATVFPDARLAFVGTGESPASASDADFVFVPQMLASRDTIGSPDLLVNMVSFQEMTGAQVRRYAEMAAAAGCPVMYSFNRERSPYNTELVTVSDALAERYQLTEVPVLNTDYTSAMKKPPKAGKPAERSEFNYRHLVGRLDPSLGRLKAAPTSSHAGPALVDRPIASASDSTRPTSTGGVVLGMTLYNNATHLPEAIESLLVQTDGDFSLILVDDASADATESVARSYAARDPRITYHRHPSRQAMVATWRDVVEIAVREHPSAEYFAWVSDHDRWHPRWLERLRSELDGDPEAVIAYPITRRIGQTGVELDKGPRLFDTTACADRRARWRHMCHAGVGAGDMVYGLMRLRALTRAGIFRRVLRPDRLLIAELMLCGGARQVPEVLWFRRESSGASVDRQRHSLVLAGDEPKWFHTPPWFQHSIVLWQEYARPENPPLPISRMAWRGMLLRYQLTYGWKHFRKTEASHAVGRGIDNVIWTKKITKHYWHHAVYNTLVGARAAWGRTRRFARRCVYELLMLTHRLGLRGREGDAMSLIARALDAVGRALHRVVHPQHVEEREMLERISRTVAAGASSERKQLERLSKQLKGVSTRMEGLAQDRDLRALHRDMVDLRYASARQRKMISQALMYAKWQEERREEERRIERRIAALAGESRTVLVGPWSGEVGFELLYWIPFVAWALKQASVSPERVVVVSRGGPASWYAHIGGRYADLLSHVTPSEFRARTEQAKKQRTMGPFDREMVRTIIRESGLGRPFLLHPGLMYKLFIPFWKEQLTVRRVDDYSSYHAIAAPAVPALAGRLPSSYVAVRFYFSSCFPDTAENRAFVESTVRSLAATTDVVLLNTGIRVDDHQDYSPGRESRIHTIDDVMTPERNLDIQTAVIANARAFVGTYGGYSYLAPLCGVPAIAFYSERDAFYAVHREIAERMIRDVNGGSLVTLDVKDAALVRAALGAAQDLHA